MRRALVLLACLLSATAWSCGDGTVIISFNSGLIVGPPRCDPPGSFDLRDQAGLTVLVVITSNTRIVLANGGAGTCDDLVAGDTVEVSGHTTGDHFVAGVVSVE